MELKEILSELDHKRLLHRSKIKAVGCPFSDFYCKSIPFNTGDMLVERKLCKDLCGKLFPKVPADRNCPCGVIKTKNYVKKKFWKVLDEVRKEQL